MNIIEPKLLKSGDTVALIAPAGSVDKDLFYKGVENFKTLGFNVKYSKKIFNENRYLAGDDFDKASEINEYFEDNSINGILCIRGGYGSIRLLDKIDYNIIFKNPKFFGGYSDITALQLMFLKKTGLISYTAPMITSDFSKDEISEFTRKSFIDTCVNYSVKYIECEKLFNGVAQGILWGGNLSTIVSLCGLDFLPDSDFIFFVEDLGEPVYKIDKMLRQLINIDKFKKYIKGIVFGDFLDVDNEEWLNDLFKETIKLLNVPAIRNKNITHSFNKLTLPIGKFVKLEKNKLFL